MLCVVYCVLCIVFASQVHIADFRSKFAPVGLDVLEMRAVWFVLQALVDSDDEKMEWKSNFKQQLDSLVAKEGAGGLHVDYIRHVAYEVGMCGMHGVVQGSRCSVDSTTTTNDITIR